MYINIFKISEISEWNIHSLKIFRNAKRVCNLRCLWRTQLLYKNTVYFHGRERIDNSILSLLVIRFYYPEPGRESVKAYLDAQSQCSGRSKRP